MVVLLAPRLCCAQGQHELVRYGAVTLNGAIMGKTPSLAARHLIYILVNALLVTAGVIVIQVGGSVAVSTGTSLVATGISGWFVFAYVLMTDRYAERLDALVETGLIEAFPARSIRIRDTYDARLNAAKKNIDLLGFGQDSFRTDYGAQFSDWVARGIRLRFLLIDPCFPNPNLSLAAQRDREEGTDDGDIYRDVRRFLSETRELRSESDLFAVRLYQCLPTINIFRIDDELFWGPYLIAEPSRNSPTFLVKRGGLLFDRMHAHFDKIWDDETLSRTAPQELCEPEQ